MSDLSPGRLPALAIPAVPLVTPLIQPLNQRLLALLAEPRPLTAEEWAYIEQQERAAADGD